MILLTTLLVFWLFSLLIIIVFLVSSLKAFKKFSGLDLETRTKLGRIDYYMILIRSFPKEKLNELSGLTDKEIEYLDTLRDAVLLKKEARKRIHAEK